jgi:hypothetical protein
MEDKKRYTKIDPKQYVQYTGPTRRYPRVNPFEKKIITPDQKEAEKKADPEANPEQENKDAATGQD